MAARKKWQGRHEAQTRPESLQPEALSCRTEKPPEEHIKPEPERCFPPSLNIHPVLLKEPGRRSEDSCHAAEDTNCASPSFSTGTSPETTQWGTGSKYLLFHSLSEDGVVYLWQQNPSQQQTRGKRAELLHFKPPPTLHNTKHSCWMKHMLCNCSRSGLLSCSARLKPTLSQTHSSAEGLLTVL